MRERGTWELYLLLNFAMKENSSKKLILLKKNYIGPDPGNLYLKTKEINENQCVKHKPGRRLPHMLYDCLCIIL